MLSVELVEREMHFVKSRRVVFAFLIQALFLLTLFILLNPFTLCKPEREFDFEKGFKGFRLQGQLKYSISNVSAHGDKSLNITIPTRFGGWSKLLTKPFKLERGKHRVTLYLMYSGEGDFRLSIVFYGKNRKLINETPFLELVGSPYNFKRFEMDFSVPQDAEFSAIKIWFFATPELKFMLLDHITVYKYSPLIDYFETLTALAFLIYFSLMMFGKLNWKLPLALSIFFFALTLYLYPSKNSVMYLYDMFKHEKALVYAVYLLAVSAALRVMNLMMKKKGFPRIF